jgi:hypothetical protein
MWSPFVIPFPGVAPLTNPLILRPEVSLCGIGRS